MVTNFARRLFMNNKYLAFMAIFLNISSLNCALKLTENLSTTEQLNEKSKNLHLLSASEIVTLMNSEDQQVPKAISKCLPEIAKAAQAIAESFKKGGRLVYLGAGSSGRLGVLDASECLPTFSADPNQVVGLIAGGDKALRTPIEGAEDNPLLGAEDLKNINLNKEDVVCGISASGSAAYVTGALKYAKDLGCCTIMLTCNPNCEKDIRKNVDVDIFIIPAVGPEILTGSTRLKAGSATKMVLNMLTTTAFVLSGKVYKNLMIDVKPFNKKLVARQKRILITLFNDLDESTAQDLLQKSGNNVKTAILMHTYNIGYDKADELLKQNNGNLKAVFYQTHHCYKNIIFDMGGVLISFNPKEVVESLFGDNQDIISKLSTVHNLPEWRELDRRTQPTEDLLKSLAQRLDLPLSVIEKFYQAILYNNHTLLKDGISLLKELKAKGYRIFLLSNMGPETYENVVIKNGFMELCDGGVFSFQTKSVKPESNIYQTLLTTYQLKAEECLFIDDIETNITAANELGIDGIVYSSHQNAQLQLQEKGVL